jgi:cupin fold WbuC family metalloprotein
MTPPSDVRRFHSRRDPARLMHAVVITSAGAPAARLDVTPPEEWLQLSVIPLADGAAMRPHAHDARQAGAPADVTQEAWIVLRGALAVQLFDDDRTLLHETTLSAGDALVTFRGGHTFQVVQPGTVIIECKNGPYLGRDYTAFEPQP